MNRLALFSLSFWMNGAESTKLGKAAHAWFSMLGKAAAWSLDNRDPMTCDERTLNLLAWERCVRRYPGEPERLYRLRVTHAYANARDSGQTAGWGRIFERLELGGLSLAERVPGQDWDRVGIIADDSQFPDQQNVLEIIIEDYGRTCRRYYFDSRIPIPALAHVGRFSWHQETVEAAMSNRAIADAGARLAVFDHHAATLEAHL
ncbi:phage tail protein [Desulfovibrio sp. UIB00]|uniref:phage tail protein n=1 Tax=Desulfovibrio sp. UIB00 TaxID=2804314 RepID=UPI001F103403|nr:phage tail protein [Desulfovibrio sp. UIB00]MCH5144112.1 phage tail protein [Desulfovibrio sp. UIB00]